MLNSIAVDEIDGDWDTVEFVRDFARLLNIQTMGELLSSPVFHRYLDEELPEEMRFILIRELVDALSVADTDDQRVRWSPRQLYVGIDVPSPPREPKPLRAWAKRHGVADLLDAPVPELAAWGGIPPGLFDHVGTPTYIQLLVPPLTPPPMMDVLWSSVGDRAREAARKQLYTEARRTALDRKRMGLWSTPLPARPLELLARALTELRDAIRSQPRALEPVLVAEIIVELHREERTLTVLHSELGKTVSLSLRDYRARPLSFDFHRKRHERAHARSLVEWTLDALFDPDHGLHEALLEIAGGFGWSRTVEALDRLVRRHSVGVVASTAPRRVTWRVDLRDGALTVRPAVQKQKKRGGWSPGSKCSPNDIQWQSAEPSPLDREIADALEIQHDYRWTRRSVSARTQLSALRALCKHELVFRADDPSKRIRLREVSPTLVVTQREELAYLELRLGALREHELAEDHARAVLFVFEPKTGVCVFCERTPLVDGLRELIETHRAGLPEDAYASLLPLLQQLQPAVGLELPPALQGRSVSRGAALVVRLTPDDESLVVSLVSAPLGEGGSVWPPGQGPTSVYGALDGERVHARRDLEQERRAVEALERELELERFRTEREHQYRVEELQPALALLTELQRRAEEGEPPLAIEWTGRKAWRVLKKRASPRDLRVKLRRGPKWFEVEGEVTVDGERIPLRELLAAARGGRRFVRVGPERFVELERALARRLADSDAALAPVRDKLVSGAAAVNVVAELVEDAAQLDIDDATSRLLERIAAGDRAAGPLRVQRDAAGLPA